MVSGGCFPFLCFSFEARCLTCERLFIFIQNLQFDQSQLVAVTEEREELKKQVEKMQEEAKK